MDPGSGHLVGRATELKRLLDALDACRTGNGALILLTGEPGIGKTRLAAEFGTRAAALGVRVHWGRCWNGGAPPYWPWRQVLRRLDESGSQSLIEALHTSGSDVADDRTVFFDAVSDTLRRAAEVEPCVIVLDDLHWADPGSLLLLRFIARESVRETRLLVIGTYRDLDARVDPAVQSPLAQAAREGRTMALGALSADDVAALARAEHPDASPAVIAELHRASGGNPLFAHEALALVCARGTGHTEQRIPDGVRAVLQERLELLGPSVRRALRDASVLGREFDVRALMALRPGADADELPMALDRAVDAGLLARRVDTSGPGLQFAHDLVRDACYRDIAPRVRAELHTLAAAFFAANPSERARHLMSALPHGNARLAVEAAMIAGRRAIDELAYEEAGQWLEQALAALDPADPDSTFEATVLLAEAQLRTGEIAAGHESGRRAAQLAIALEDGDRLARAALVYGIGAPIGRVDPSLVEMLERALKLLDARAPLRSLIQARLAAAMMPNPEPSVAHSLARSAIADARSNGGRATLAKVLSTARAAFFSTHDVHERIAIDTETLTLATALDNRILAIAATRRLADAHLELGDLSRSLAFERSRDDLDVRSAHGYSAFDRTLRRASLDASAGRFDSADAAIEQARILGERLRERTARTFPLDPVRLLRALRVLIQGAVDPIEATLATIGEYPALAQPRIAAALLARLGRLDEARVQYERALLGGLPDTADLFIRALLPEVCVALGDRARAPRFLELLEPIADRAVTWAPIGAYMGAAARVQGLLLDMLGHFDHAAARFEFAIAFDTRMDAAPFVARSRAALASTLIRRNARGDGDRAETLRVDGRAVFTRLGMDLDLSRVLAIEQRVVRNEKTPGPYELPTFVREGESWCVSFRGSTWHFVDSDGLRYIEFLISRPGESVHALDLLAMSRRSRGVGNPAAGEIARQENLSTARSAAEPLERLDPRAKASYRQRVEELREMLEEAERMADHGRVERARDELDFLARELSGAVGLGGRDRPIGADAERARVNVTLRIRKAIGKLERAAPEVAKLISTHLQTGAFCTFRRP